MAVGGLFLAGLTGSIVSGVFAGWLRYWFGFMVIFHGLVFVLLAIGMFSVLRPARRPGLLWSNQVAWRSAPFFLLAFWAAQGVGLGLAQPVFDPLDYFFQIANGTEGESFVAMTRVRSYTGGMSGLLWVFSSLLDSGLMLVLFATLMRDDESIGPNEPGEDEAHEDSEDPEEPGDQRPGNPSVKPGPGGREERS